MQVIADRIDEPASLGERYSRATESSDLRVKEGRGDVDYMIAAGWGGNQLGSLLYRLRCEFEQARSSVRPAQALNLTERLLVLAKLTSLYSTKQALGALAVQQATRQNVMLNDAVVLVLAGRCLEVFLDPLCGHCDGRGFSGGGRHEHSGPQVICRPCGGTGRRRNTIGRDDRERNFGGNLLMEMQRAADLFETRMGRRLRNQSA